MAQDTTEKIMSVKAELRAATLEAQKLGIELVKLKESADVDPASIAKLEAQMTSAVEKTALLKDQINDTNEQIKVLTAGSPFEKMSNSIGDVGSKIMSLDFEGANESAQRLVQIGKSINFGTAIQSVKDLGSTFLNLGKALLTNPLFLIAATIALLVIAIVKVMDKIGLLKVITQALGKVFEWIMIPINAIIDGLKSLTDWLGWTNNAAQEAAEKQAAAAEKTAAAYEEKSAGVVRGYDTEIKLAELAGEDTRKAEIKKAYWILNTAKARAKADFAAYQSAKIAGELDEEELKDLEKKYKVSIEAAKQAGDDIKILKATFAAEDKANRQKEIDDTKASEEKKNEARKKAADDWAKKQAEINAARLAADKYLEDLIIQNMEEGTDKEIAALNLKYARLQEANMANAKITAEQRKAIDQQLATQRFNEEKAILKKEADEIQATVDEANANRKAKQDEEAAKELERQKAYAQLKRETGKSQLELDLMALDEEYAAKRELAGTDMALQLQLTEEFNAKKAEIQKKADEEENARRMKTAMAALDVTKAGLQGISDLVGAFAGKSRAAQKRAFETQKKLNIAISTIDTIKGAVSAFTGMTSTIPGPVGIALGAVAAAGVVASGVANIKKITSTTFEGGGNPGGAAPTNAVPSGGAATPSFNLIGGGNDANNLQGPQAVQTNQQQNLNINVSVSETEITNTQNKVSQIKESATL